MKTIKKYTFYISDDDDLSDKGFEWVLDNFNMEYVDKDEPYRISNLDLLLNELEETKKQIAYENNHLLDTMIKRVKELLNNVFETNTKIGF